MKIINRFRDRRKMLLMTGDRLVDMMYVVEMSDNGVLISNATTFEGRDSIPLWAKGRTKDR